MNALVPLAVSTGDVIIGIALLALAGLQGAFASRLLAAPWPRSALERRQSLALSIAFLLLGMGRLTGAELVGDIGLVAFVVAVVLVLLRHRRGEDVLAGLSLRRRR